MEYIVDILGKQQVAVAGHTVFQQPVNEDHRLAGKFLELAHLLKNDRPVVHHGLNVQFLDVLTGIAGAASGTFEKELSLLVSECPHKAFYLPVDIDQGRFKAINR